MKTKVYIAGPYTKPDPVVNSNRAMQVWATLHSMGYIPICPHWSMFQHLVSPLTHQQWLDYDFEIIRGCRVMLRLPGESTGADMEEKFATECGIPVVPSVEYLLEVFPP